MRPRPRNCSSLSAGVVESSGVAGDSSRRGALIEAACLGSAKRRSDSGLLVAILLVKSGTSVPASSIDFPIDLFLVALLIATAPAVA